MPAPPPQPSVAWRSGGAKASAALNAKEALLTVAPSFFLNDAVGEGMKRWGGSGSAAAAARASREEMLLSSVLGEAMEETRDASAADASAAASCRALAAGEEVTAYGLPSAAATRSARPAATFAFATVTSYVVVEVDVGVGVAKPLLLCDGELDAVVAEDVSPNAVICALSRAPSDEGGSCCRKASPSAAPNVVGEPPRSVDSSAAGGAEGAEVVGAAARTPHTPRKSSPWRINSDRASAAADSTASDATAAAASAVAPDSGKKVAGAGIEATPRRRSSSPINPA